MPHFAWRTLILLALCSFFASENDMNALIRGVRFAMRIGRAECAKGVFEPKGDSTDTKGIFYMGDADPDRVRLIYLLLISPPFLTAGADLFAIAWYVQITDEEIKEYILAHCSAAFHPVSSFLPSSHVHPSTSRERRGEQIEELMHAYIYCTDIDRSHRRITRDGRRRSPPTRVRR